MPKGSHTALLHQRLRESDSFITDVGFQLSYLAVTGIVWLYKPLCTLYAPRNRVIRFVWQTSVLSIAATLITFPLSLFYFKQFPNLFLITNLIAVPLSTIIIYTGILVLAASPVNFLSAFFSVLMAKMLWFLNSIIRFIESQPFAVSRGIHITTGELFLLYLLVVTLAGHFLIKKRIYLYYAATASLLFLAFATIRRVNNLHQKTIVAYAVNNLTVLNFIDGNRDIMILDSSFHENKNTISYHILNHRILSGVKSAGQIITADQNFKNEHFIKKGNFMQFYDKSLALIDSGFQQFPLPARQKTDYLVLSNDPDFSISELTEIFDFKLIIIGKSNSFWKKKHWINECKLSGINYYDVSEKGAWLEKI